MASDIERPGSDKPKRGWFDNLTVWLTGRHTRREVLRRTGKGAAATVLGGLIPLAINRQRAGAQSLPFPFCITGADCPSGHCIPIDLSGLGICSQGCVSDYDCPDEEQCVSGQCVLEPCDENADCPSGRPFCVGGRCLQCIGTGEESQGCPDEKICLNHVCVAEHCDEDADCPAGHPYCLNPGPNGRCVQCKGIGEESQGCPDEKVCVNNVCVAEPCDETADCAGGQRCCEGSPNFCAQCCTDNDCPDGRRCSNHICVPETAQCDDDYDCPNGQICSNGTCTQNCSTSCVNNYDCQCPNYYCQQFEFIGGVCLPLL
jgi:hypothetical protein